MNTPTPPKEVKTAEEILKTYELFKYREDSLDETHIYFDNAVLAMQEYAAQFKQQPEGGFSKEQARIIFKAGVEFGDANCEFGGETNLPNFDEWYDKYAPDSIKPNPTEVSFCYVWVKASERTPDKAPDNYKRDEILSCRFKNHKGIKVPCTATFDNGVFYFEEFSPKGTDEYGNIEWLSTKPQKETKESQGE